MSKAALSTSTPLLNPMQVICGNTGQGACSQSILQVLLQLSYPGLDEPEV